MCTHTNFLHSDTLSIVSSFHSFSFIFPVTASIDLTICIYSTVPCMVIVLFYTISPLYVTLGSETVWFCRAALFGKLCKWSSSVVVYSGVVLPTGELWCLILQPAIITFLKYQAHNWICVWAWISSAEVKIELAFLYMTFTFLVWWYESVCRGLQMPDVFASPPLLFFPLPLVPAWAQGLNQSIRAPGTRAQQSLCPAQRSAALSGSVHLWPAGELGEEGEPWCPLHAGFTWGLLSRHSVTPELWRNTSLFET